MMMVSTLGQFFCFFMITILLYFAQKPEYAAQEEVAQSYVLSSQSKSSPVTVADWSSSIVFFFLFFGSFGIG